MSDVQATTQAGAAVPTGGSDDHFQSLWDSGAFDPNGVPPKEGNEGTGGAVTGAVQDGTQGDGAQGQQAPQGQQGGEQGQEGAQAAAEEAPAYASLDELLTSMKVDPESARALPVTVKIDGIEKQVPLSDVLKSYQLEGHVNNKSIELSNQRTAFEQERGAWRNGVQQALQQHQQMAAVAMQILNQDFSKIDWNALRVANPAEFAALQAEYGQRQQQIQSFVAQVQQQQQQDAAQQQQAFRQSLAQEHEKLLGAVPAWRDGAAFAKDRDQMTQYARSLGFQDAELSQIFDHRYMLILHDAARFRALQAATPQALKQVRQAPPQAAPGSRTNANPNDARRQAAIDRFNRNPGDEDAQAAVFSLFTD